MRKMSLERRLDKLEDALIQQEVDQQMVGLARVTEALGLPASCLPGIRRHLEEVARAEAAHGPMAPDELEAAIQREAQQAADRLSAQGEEITAEEIIAEAERIGELWRALT